MNILYLSNAVGWGHVTRDIRIAEVIKAEIHNSEITFFSSGGALQYIRQKVWPLVENNNGSNTFSETIEKVSSAIRLIHPDLIITDEELVALPLAQTMFPKPIPTILISEYLPSHIGTNSIPFNQNEELAFFKKADSILITDFPKHYPIHDQLRSKVAFTGPIIASNGHRSESRIKLCRQYKVGENAAVIILTGGGRVSQGKDIFALGIEAFKSIKISDKNLIILAQERRDELQSKVGNDKSIMVLGPVYDTDDLWSIADVVITRGGHTTLWELAAQGVPSISIPFPPNINQLNYFFSYKMSLMGTTTVIKEHELTMPYFALQLESSIRSSNLRAHMDSIREKLIQRSISWQKVICTEVNRLSKQQPEYASQRR